ncbi:MAG: PAS domain S-box protein [Verrucomicrobiota bacterium]
MNWNLPGHSSDLAPRGSRLLSGIIAALLLGGCVAGFLRGRAFDHYLRQMLLSQAVALAETIDPDRVQGLTFSPGDVTNVCYQEIRQQMVTYGRAVGLPSIYSQALRGGQIVFGPENLDPTSPLASPPGTVYRQPSPANRELFRTGKAFTEGPVFDEYGGFISAYAPVIHARSREVMMVVGVDVQASEWQSRLWQSRLVPLLVTAALVLAFAVGIPVLGRQLRRRFEPHDSGRYLEIATIIWGGLVLSLGGALLAHDREERQRQEVFAQMADRQVALLRKAEQQVRDSLRIGLAPLVEADGQLHRSQFQLYASSLLSSPSVQAFVWVDRVRGSDRLRKEAEFRAEGRGEFQIVELNDAREKVRAREREVYYPVVYSQPLPSQGSPIGFDLGSDPRRRAALRRAESTGLSSGTEPIALMHETERRNGFVAYHPIYEPGKGPTEAPRGFCAAIIAFDVLLEKALGGSSWSDDVTCVNWYQVREHEPPVWLASRPRVANPPAVFPSMVVSAHPASLALLHPVFSFGKTYVIAVTPGPAFIEAQRATAGWIAMLVGTALTGLTAALVGFMRCHHSRLERQVAERTTALRETEQFTRQIIANAGQGIVVYDLALRHRFWNPFMEVLTGVSAGRILGEDLAALALHFEHACVRDLLERALTSETVQSPDLYYRVRATGKTGWISAIYAPNLDADGQIIGVIGTVRDITARKETEQALTQSEIWHRGLFENAADAIFVVDGSSRKFTGINPAALRMFGLPTNALSEGLGPVQLSPEFQPDGRRSEAKVDEMIDLALEHGSHFFQWTHCRRSGEEFASTVLITRMELPGQVFCHATVRDVTQENLAATLLAQRTALLAGLLDSIPDLVCFKSRSGVYLGCNPEFGRYAGKSPEEITGLTDLDLFPKPVAESMRQHEAIVLEQGCRRYSEAWLTYPDGRRMLVETLRAPFYSPEREVIGVIDVSRDITERNQTAEVLQARQAKLDSIFRAAPVAIGVAVERILTELNDTFCQITGYARGDLIGKSARLLYPTQAEFDRVAEEGYDRLAEQGMFMIECRWRCKDGHDIEVLLRASHVVPNDVAKGVTFVGLDITERKAAEAALRHSEERFRQMAETIQCVFWMSSSQLSEITYVSPGYERLWGRTVASLYNDPKSFLHAAHPEDRPRLFESLRRSAGKNFDHEFRIIRPDGQVRWIRDRGFPIRAASGQVLQMVGIAEDVTERKEAEAMLRTAAGRLRMLWQAVEESLTSVVITDTTGRIEYVNPKFIEVTGYALEEVLGQNPRLLKSGQTSPAFYTDMWRTIASGRNWRGEFWNRKKSGELFWESAVISPVKDENGTITHFLGIKEDITERKRAEAELHQTNHQLQEATARASQMASKAEAANGAKSQFLANVSHEIRTPLNGIIGPTGLLLETSLTPDQRKYAEIAKSSGETLLALINDILDLSKIEAHKLDLEMIPFDLRQLLEDTAEFLALKAHEKSLELICDVGPDVPARLRGDPGRLRQILVNLGGNAVKFTRKGEVRIRARRQAEDEQRVTILVEVSDTGIGIPREKLATLFAPFTQVDGSITRQFGGTGLGLSISKQLAELMGGRIGVESDQGQGARFWFTAVCEKERANPTATNTADGRLADLKVLVVDDNETNRLMVTTWLGEWGCNCVAVGDPVEGLNVLRQAALGARPFRVALLDFVMPDMDGVALGRQIKADPTLEQTRLILLGSARPALLQQAALSDLFSEVLTKPIRPIQLEKALELALGDLPARKGTTAVAKTEASATGASSVHLRILLAEDQPANQLVVMEILRKLACQVSVVSTGLAAIHALQRDEYDLVLMDCQMPEMDGLEATRRIRKGEAGPAKVSIPIVALTAHAMEDQRERSLLAGMDEHVSKPVTVAGLRDLLARWRIRLSRPSEPVVALKPVAVTPSSPAPAPPSSGTPLSLVFNRSDFLNRTMDDEALAKRVASAFLQDLPRQIALFKAAVMGANMDQTALIAHRLKGSSGSVGGEVFHRLIAQVEKTAQKADSTEVTRLLGSVEIEAAGLAAALTAFIHEEVTAAQLGLQA